VFEGQDLAQRGIAKQHETGTIGELRRPQDLIRFQCSNFLTKVIPACAGLVDGKHS
jgi:hypothetical protein